MREIINKLLRGPRSDDPGNAEAGSEWAGLADVESDASSAKDWRGATRLGLDETAFTDEEGAIRERVRIAQKKADKKIAAINAEIESVRKSMQPYLEELERLKADSERVYSDRTQIARDQAELSQRKLELEQEASNIEAAMDQLKHEAEQKRRAIEEENEQMAHEAEQRRQQVELNLDRMTHDASLHGRILDMERGQIAHEEDQQNARQEHERALLQAGIESEAALQKKSTRLEHTKRDTAISRLEREDRHHGIRALSVTIMFIAGAGLTVTAATAAIFLALTAVFGSVPGNGQQATNGAGGGGSGEMPAGASSQNGGDGIWGWENYFSEDELDGTNVENRQEARTDNQRTRSTYSVKPL